MTVLLFTLYSASVLAGPGCPQGTTLTGGTGPEHKGGKCVANSSTKTHKESKTTVKTTETKTKADVKTAPKP